MPTNEPEGRVLIILTPKLARTMHSALSAVLKTYREVLDQGELCEADKLLVASDVHDLANVITAINAALYKGGAV